MKYIGIDPGTKTGYAVYDTEAKQLETVETTKLHLAFTKVLDLHNSEDVVVRFEDARLRKWYGNAGREKLQGVGSVKRDCKAWEDFLQDYSIEYHAVPPSNNMTKLTAASFKQITGYQGKTSEHGRDASMLVYGM